MVIAESPAAFWALDDASGNTAVDATGNGHDGTYIGNPSLASANTPMGGSAVTLSNALTQAGQRIDVPYSPDLNPNSYTLEAWVKLNQLPGMPGDYGASDWRSILCARDRDGEQVGYQLYVADYNGGARFAFLTGGPPPSPYSPNPVSYVVYDAVNTVQLGHWYHVVATMKNDSGSTPSLHLYVNGADVTSSSPGPGTSLPTNCGDPTRIGACQTTSGTPTSGFAGSLSDIAIYDHVLGSDEISLHREVGVGNTPPPPPPPTPELTLSDPVRTSPLTGNVAHITATTENVPDGTSLTAEITGANEQILHTSVSGGTATFFYTGLNVGEDDVEVSGTVGDDSVYDSLSLDWLAGSNSTEGSLGALDAGSGSGSYLNLAVAYLSDPVNSATGNFYQSATDVSLPGTGIPFSLARTYNSRDESVGPLGRGWSANVFTSLAIDDAGNVSLKAGSGQEVGFVRQPDGSFQGDTNVTATLSKSGSGYDLVQKDQDVQNFDSGGRIVSWLDQNGQGLHFAYGSDGRLASVTDSAGREIDFSYDESGHLAHVALPDGTALSYGYDGDLLTSFTDQASAITHYAYDSTGFLKSASDGSGKILFENTYDDQGRVLTQKDASGNTGSFDWSDGHVTATDAADSEWKDSYNDSGQLSTRTDALGNDASYDYDDANNLLSLSDPLNHETTMTYDERGNMLSQTNALGGTESWVYDSDNNIINHTDALGNATHYTYDSNGNVTSEIDPLGNVNTYEYDSAGRRIAQTDPLRRTTRSIYDDQGNLIEKISPSGGKTTYTYDAMGNQLSETNPLDHTTTSSYDGAGRLIKTVDPLGHTTISVYDDAGRVIAETDARGNTTHYQYDENGRQRAAISPDGSSTHTEYDALGNVVASTDVLGNVTRYEYDADGRQTATISPNGKRAETRYDADGKPIASIDALDKSSTSRFDALGREVKSTDALGRTTKNVYDAAGNVVKTIDPLGYETTSKYDADGRVIEETNPLGYTTKSSYDAAGQLISETDGNGNITLHGYDADGNEVSVTSPSGGVSTSVYNANGNLISSTDANGRTTTYAYDADGNKVSETNPLGEKTTYGFDANGNRASETDPLGNASRTVYDQMNQPVEQIDPLGNITKTAYDPNGSVVATTDPLGNTIHYEYDSDGRQVKEIDPLGNSTLSAYDKAGRLVSKTDSNGYTTQYAYNAVGQKTSLTAPDGSVTSYDYDANGNMVTRTDGNGHATSYTYNAVGHKLSKKNALGSTWRYSYDSNGNFTETKTPSGGTITQAYDSENRLTSKSYSDGTPTVSYTYDLVGNKLSMTDGTGTTHYAYDATDQLLSALSIDGGFLYTYDLNGNISSRIYPNGLKTSYSYNDAGEMVAASVKGKVTRYSHDPNGNLTSTLHPNGILDTRSYDAAGHLTEIRGNDPRGKLLYSRSYTYDSVGNPLTLVATASREHSKGWWGKAWLHKGDSLSRWQETYSYDSRDRLTKACMNESCSRYYRYSYDPVGNRTGLETKKSTTSYSYDAADELVSANKQKHGHPNHDKLTLYTYDLNGNETGEGSTHYGYNLENKLVQIVDKGKKISYTYTGDGLMKTRSSHSETTTYAWEINSDLAQLAVESTRKGQGWFVVPDTTSYTYGEGPIGTETRRGSYTFHSDSLGSVVELSDDHGKLAESYRYTPYGESYSSDGGDSPSSIRFAGQYLDSESVLYNMRAREYDPETGRFLETDPLQCGESCSSAYVYAEDQPTVLIDPSGEGAMSSSGVPFYGAEYLDPRMFTVPWSCSASQATKNNPWCHLLPKSFHAIFYASGTFNWNRHPGAGTTWKQEIVSTHNGWRICAYGKYGTSSFCNNSKGPNWLYDEEALDHTREYQALKEASTFARNKPSAKGYVFVVPGDAKSWPRHDPPSSAHVRITRHLNEVYNSGTADPTRFSGWAGKKGVPTVAVRLGSLRTYYGQSVGKNAFSICEGMHGGWIGLYTETWGSYIDVTEGTKDAIKKALDSCSNGWSYP
jgi:RHS repeat-associated protein